MTCLIAFIAGFMIGGIVGAVGLAVLAVGGADDG